MGLLDDLQDPSIFKHRTVKIKCFTCALLTELPKEEAAALEKVLRSNAPSTAISEALKKNGHIVNVEAIANHRRTHVTRD